ncbi:methylamine utilization protein MauJ [Agrobacterium sp. RAC06]|uniref:methylamine utilization protein MauJ n=1 Tax=Agrobacterium sp. RAC06 TaxID=1842536 RepID=UPI00083DC7DE|nr:methylamine utilization protein MauJ [Agrobacterium sp. RAC06]AOG11913.1 hypothetical protein BSY240_4074 [Agrobacterium sp. RAC06]
MPSLKSELKTVTEVYSGALTEVGNWCCGYVKVEFLWPDQVYIQSFEGRDFFLVPPCTGPDGDVMYAAVALKLAEAEEHSVGAKAINELLSAMTWSKDKSAVVVAWGGGRRLHPCLGKESADVTDRAYFPDLPENLSEKAKLALALYREGKSMDHVVYACLSFLKILNVQFSNPHAQMAWINNSVASICGHEARRRLEELTQTESDVGQYLFVSSRCAIAHAFASPLVNPDDPSDERRLRQDYPLIKELAVVVVEQVFGVRSPSTVYAEHLYELAGFKEWFPSDVRENATLLAQSCGSIRFPRLRFELVGRDGYAPLDELEATFLEAADGCALIECRSVRYPVSIKLYLNFAEERLQLDLLNGVWCGDDGTADAAQAVSDMLRFRWDYYRQYIFQVRSVPDDIVLGRASAFIPENHWLDPNELNEVRRFEDLAQMRRAAKNDL